eukprot:13757211-Alexandrium_andersonii.AAC.1
MQSDIRALLAAASASPVLLKTGGAGSSTSDTASPPRSPVRWDPPPAPSPVPISVSSWGGAIISLFGHPGH